MYMKLKKVNWHFKTVCFVHVEIDYFEDKQDDKMRAQRLIVNGATSG